MLRCFRYIDRFENGNRLVDDSEIREDVDRIGDLVDEKYGGYSPALEDTFLAEATVLDDIPTTLDLSGYYQ